MRLQHAAELALIAADGPEPADGARYILDTVSDLALDMRALAASVPDE